jgi:hypothetical protein
MADKVNKKAAEREKKIEEQVKRLNAPKAKDRREAAYWLGEAAAVSEIPELVRVYQTDKDGGVRAAAAYALGQFKAVEEALASGQQKKVEKLLHQVEMEGKLGSRGGRGRWMRLALGLLLAFLAFVALSWIVYGGPGGLSAALQGVIGSVAPASSAAQPTPDVVELSLIATDLQAAWAPVKADVTALQGEFTSVLAGNAPNCSAFFNLSAPYALPAEAASRYPQLGALGTRLNEVQASFQQAYAAFDAACNGGEPLSAATVGPVYASLRPALEAAPQMDAALLAFGLLLTPSPTPAVSATPVPTATPVPPTATPGPTALPTTSIQLTDPRRYIVEALSVTDRMLGSSGPATVLNENWQAASAVSRPAGCNTAAPALPDDFVLPDDVAEASPDLVVAAQELNEALELLQTGWTNFVFACGANVTSSSAVQGQADAANIIARLTLVQERLQVLAGL